MATIALFMPDGHRRARCQSVDSPQVTEARDFAKPPTEGHVGEGQLLAADQLYGFLLSTRATRSRLLRADPGGSVAWPRLEMALLGESSVTGGTEIKGACVIQLSDMWLIAGAGREGSPVTHVGH